MRPMCLHKALFLSVSLVCIGWRVSGDEGRLWPPFAERETLSRKDEAALLAEWKAAKASGLLARREELLDKVSCLSEGHRGPYFRFRNPALVDMMAEYYRIEYGYWKRYESGWPEQKKPYEAASCPFEVASRGEGDESEMEYTSWVNYVALSTYSPAIIDIAVSYYCDRPEERLEYLKEVVPEEYGRALLDAKVETRGGRACLIVDFHGGAPIEVLTGLRQLNAILADHPELRAANSGRIGPFMKAVRSACIPQDPAKACDMNPRQRAILKNLERLAGQCE